MADKRILVIMEKEVKPGFQLAGVEVWAANDSTEAQGLVERAMDDGKYGIIILEESFLENFDPRVRNEVLDSVVPLVVPVNIKEAKKMGAQKYLEDMIRRAIGFQIRVRG
jgi:vacuolar-type H+-ATPase subunit F/Vma7